MPAHVSRFLMLALLLADIIFSFFQHYYMPLDGDMAGIILPSEGYNTVLNDPFGLNVILQNKSYPAPNRFFAHWFMSGYFKTVPLFLQNIVSPVASVYLACAIIKIITQVFLIYFMSLYAGGVKNIFRKEFLLPALLITPFFQANGFHRQMGIIDETVTYAIFYAWPLIFLLWFFWPFYKAYYLKKDVQFGFVLSFLLLGLIIFLSLNGPLIPGIVLVICPAVVLFFVYRNYQIENQLPFITRILRAISSVPKPILIFFPLFSAACLYSLFIGLHNSEGLEPINQLPVAERFARLPIGLFKQFTKKIGLGLLLILLLINTFLLKKYGTTPESKRLLTQLKWIGIFALVFTLLLPLGGYRDYRFYIVRRDTFLPVILAMIYFFAVSSIYLLNQLPVGWQKKYSIGLVALLLLYTITDTLGANRNTCEKEAILFIAQSPEQVVPVSADCTIMWWDKITNPQDSQMNAALFQYWGITQEKKLFYQK